MFSADGGLLTFIKYQEKYIDTWMENNCQQQEKSTGQFYQTKFHSYLIQDLQYK